MSAHETPKFTGISSLMNTPELAKLVKAKPENLAIFKELSMKMARDPEYLSYLEKTLTGPVSPTLESLLKETPAAATLEAHKWEAHPDLPSPKKAAAALAPAAMALAES